MKFSAAILLIAGSSAVAFTNPSTRSRKITTSTSFSKIRQSASIVAPKSTSSAASFDLSASAASSSAPSSSSSDGEGTNNAASSITNLTKQQKRQERIKEDGGFLAFNTKYGALNPFAIYYGLTSIGLGLVWFLALTLSQLMYKITDLLGMGWVDRNRRIPVFLSHVWGTSLMTFTGCLPKVENGDIIKNFHKSGRAAMFVANHNSWMDIPFLGHTIGWKNYKFVAKKELEKVPILGKAILVGRNVLVDRTDRKSQLLTLKQGMKWLEDGVSLCTFPEGTRTRTNRLMPFKNGAFKMAHKARAPVVPISICNASKVMPSYWMFPFRPASGVCRVVVHDPIESTGKTEEDLAEEVRRAIVSGLPEEQRPVS